jgi:hypothetical protein
MLVKTRNRLSTYLRPEYPQELLQRRYAVTRAEMLWRDYVSSKARGDPEAVRYALSVLRVIRESPD